MEGWIKLKDDWSPELEDPMSFMYINLSDTVEREVSTGIFCPTFSVLTFALNGETKWRKVHIGEILYNIINGYPMGSLFMIYNVVYFQLDYILKESKLSSSHTVTVTGMR